MTKTNNRRPLNFIVSGEVFPFDVMVSIGQTDKEFRKSYKANLLPEEVKFVDTDVISSFENAPSRCGRCIMILDGGRTLLRVRLAVNDPNDHAIVAHEIYHAATFILDRIGITYSESSDEAYACTIGYLTKKIYEKIRLDG